MSIRKLQDQADSVHGFREGINAFDETEADVRRAALMSVRRDQRAEAEAAGADYPWEFVQDHERTIRGGLRRAFTKMGLSDAEIDDFVVEIQMQTATTLKGSEDTVVGSPSRYFDQVAWRLVARERENQERRADAEARYAGQPGPAEADLNFLLDLERALREVSRARANAVAMWLNRYTIKETAEVLGRSAAAVKKLRDRGLADLQEALPLRPDPGPEPRKPLRDFTEALDDPEPKEPLWDIRSDDRGGYL